MTLLLTLSETDLETSIAGTGLLLDHKRPIPYELTFSHLPAQDPESPIDAIEWGIHLRDVEGRPWSATGRTPSDFLLERLAATQFDNWRLCLPVDDAPDALRALFDAPLCANIRYSSDDRLYRSLRLRGEWVQVMCRSSTLYFDLALNSTDELLYARLQAGYCYDQNTPLSTLSRMDELPALLFEVGEPALLFRRNTGYLDADGQWSESVWPQPLRFSPSETR